MHSLDILYREFSNPESDTELNVDAIINHGLHFEKVSLGEFLTRGLLNYEKLAKIFMRLGMTVSGV
jgi:hypothetical protein